MNPVADIRLDDSYKALITELAVYIKESVFSEAALNCTEKIIEHNGGHYTSWSFRRKVLFALKKPLDEELEFIKNFTNGTPKNYQSWQHRQIIVQQMKSVEVAAKDLEDTKEHLNSDAKNIHCWQYRQWLIKYFELPVESELIYTETLLKEDVYNNSAWNHRFFLTKSSDSYKSNAEFCLISEFDKIIELFLSESNEDNECFWNYLAALVNDSPAALSLENVVIPKLTEKIGSVENSRNYLYLRFISRFDVINRSEICEKLKELRPINRSFWTLLSQNNLILNFEFTKAEKQLRETADMDTNETSLNLGIIEVIRTLVTSSETNYNKAILKLTNIQSHARELFLTTTFKLYPKADMFTIKTLQLIDDNRFLKSTDKEFVEIYSKRSEAELIAAQCSIMKIFLKCIFTGQHSNIFSCLLDESEIATFRISFMILYHSHERLKSLPSDNILKMADSDYQSGLKLAWGLCCLLTILLPSPLSIIIGTSKFQLSSISEALKMIESAAAVDGINSLNNILATLILVMYHSDIKGDQDEAKKYLENLNQPKSTMFQYFQAKILRLQGQISSAIETFLKIRLIPSIVQLPVYWQMIQCFTESQKWPEAMQYTRYLRDYDSTVGGGGFPSKIFSFYLEAAFMQASTGRAFGPLSFEVQRLLENVLEAARGKHRAPRPLLDRLAIFRARNVLERNEHFFLPHFEILLLWDRLKGIAHREFVTSQVRKALESSEQLTLEQQALGWLILAILSENPNTSATLIVNHILPREKALPSTSFICIRAKCELARCHLIEGRIEDARALLNEIESRCFDKNGFPGQTTILLLLSKMKHKIE